MNLLITISSVGHSMRIEDEPFVRITNYTLHYLQNISSYHGFKNRTRGETVFASSSQFNLVFSDWIGGWFLVQPARPAGPVWLLKPCILYNFFLDKRYNLINIYIYIYKTETSCRKVWGSAKWHSNFTFCLFNLFLLTFFLLLLKISR